MNKTWKVAKWEIKRNLKNKSFIIGLFSTPVIFLAFYLLGHLFGDSGEEGTKVLVRDDLNIVPALEEVTEQFELPLEWEVTDLDESKAIEQLEELEYTAYIHFDEEGLNTGVFSVYTTDKISSNFQTQMQIFSEAIKGIQLSNLGLTQEQMEAVTKTFLFEQTKASDVLKGEEEEKGSNFEKIVPGLFAGIILFSIVVTGMMILTSASQEKKDKIAEIILSSVSPNELMQGKIIGYFVLGMIQTAVILLFGIPFVIFQFDQPILQYIFVPETLLLVFLALLGYLLFAAIFVGIGATMADMTTAGNFQGVVMMLPFLPIIFMGPVFSNPSGIVAKVGSYIPFSASGVLIMRLSMLDEWPWVEIMIAIAILIISIWLFMKLAGKIFKVGILMYGKNASPQEIWKWIRA